MNQKLFSKVVLIFLIVILATTPDLMAYSFNPPHLSSPVNGDEVIKGQEDFYFSVTGADGASYIEYWMDNNSGFGSPEIGFNNGASSNWQDDGIGSVMYNFTKVMQNALPQNVYYIKARMLNASKNPISDWSNVRNFKLLDSGNTGNCTWDISPGSKSFTYLAGTGSISVDAKYDNCAWTASDNRDWITITSGSSGTGDGTVNFSVIENTSENSRSGTITVAGNSFTVTQAGKTVTHNYDWKTGSWSVCPTNCGTSTQTRSVWCERDDGITVADSYCFGAKPSSSQTCTDYSGCPPHNYTWETGSWSDCSTDCGTGNQNRNVWCERDDGVIVSDGNCFGAKPASFQECTDNSGCNKPTVQITSHTDNQYVSDPNIVFAGTANDNDGRIVEVITVINTNQSTANGTTDWWQNMTLKKGENNLCVWALDDDNLWSDIICIKVNLTESNYHRFNAYFDEAGAKYEVPSNLLRAIAYTESKWATDSNTFTGTGKGIMQIEESHMDAIALRLQSDYPNEYGGMTLQEVKNLLAENSDRGAQANIRGAASKLKYDSYHYKTESGETELIFNDEPREALEVWWFVVTAYNGGGEDGLLTTSNYPFRVYNNFITGKTGLNQLGQEVVMVPKIPITFPPHTTFTVATQAEIDKHEVNSSDWQLIPTSPPPVMNGTEVKEGILRRTMPFKACRDLYYLHGNDGSLLEGICPEKVEFRVNFPIKGQGPYGNGSFITSVYDWCRKDFAGYGERDGYVVSFKGVYGKNIYGVKAVGTPPVYGYRAKSSGYNFSDAIDNYDDGYLYYDGHPAYDYRADLKTPLLAVEDGTVCISSRNYGTVRLDHGNGFYSQFLHCALSSLPKKDTFFKKNEVVAFSGDTGKLLENGTNAKTDPHLHLEFIKKVGDKFYSFDPYGWQGNSQDGWTRALNSTVWDYNPIGGVGIPYYLISALTCRDVVAGANPGELSPVSVSDVFDEGDTVYFFAELQDITADWHYDIKLYQDGILFWERESPWNSPSDLDYISEELVSDADTGDYRVEAYIDIGDGFESLSFLNFSVIGADEYIYYGDFTDTLNDFSVIEYVPHNSIFNLDPLGGPDGSQCLVIDSPRADECWHIEVKKVGLNIQEGKKYQVSFWAKAENASFIPLAILHDISPWETYGLWRSFNIGTEWTEYSAEFTAENNPKEEEVRLCFELGCQSGKVWIDDVLVKEVADVTVATSTTTSSTTTSTTSSTTTSTTSSTTTSTSTIPSTTISTSTSTTTTPSTTSTSSTSTSTTTLAPLNSSSSSPSKNQDGGGGSGGCFISVINS